MIDVTNTKLQLPRYPSKAYHGLSSPSQHTVRTALQHTIMPSTTAISPPEKYFLTKPTPHVPNSRLPVLIYRSVILANPTPDSICAAIEPNDWIKGGIFKHYPAHHFHSVTHELYAVFKGHSHLLLGRGPLDEESGVEVDLRVGDCIVLPAGVAHCCRNTISLAPAILCFGICDLCWCYSATVSLPKFYLLQSSPVDTTPYLKPLTSPLQVLKAARTMNMWACIPR